MTTTAMERTGKQPGPRRRTPARLLRKTAVAIAGTSLIIAGIALLVLPGPGVVAILAGLGLLGTEFPAARRLSTRLNAHTKTAWHKLRATTSKTRTPTA